MTESPWIMPSDPAAEADVCLIVEGCYPYVRGGVSSWLDWLMRTCPQTTFSVVAIVASGADRTVRYHPQSNLVDFREIELQRPVAPLTWLPDERAPGPARELADLTVRLLNGGGLDEFRRLDRLVNGGAGISYDALVSSLNAWMTIRTTYERLMPQASFLHFFWAWRALCGGLFATLKAPVPKAKTYHAISTGYAGLFAARAGVETGRPVVLTEHGIYTNERRIEIMMAGWIADTIDKGLSIGDPRIDLRDVWMKAFDAYARCCYQASHLITTLYADNQILQRELGADDQRLRVIANGIERERFDGLSRAGGRDRPTVALIGRVVPIKDVKTYLLAAARARENVPDLAALVIGPTDEDPAYFAECEELVAELGLAGCVTFTGNVDITQYLPRIHVVALTSLSEAQPLVLLEAGAAHIPCIATDVGSCREILEGRMDERPNLGRGGIVCPLVDVEAIADAMTALLTDEQLRSSCGEALSRRVQDFYASEAAAEAYRRLYQSTCALPDGASPGLEAA